MLNYPSVLMELLLNLIWLTLGMGSFLIFLRRRPQPARRLYRQEVLALACALLLLFPVVSASDDLHPAQALLEEASKRVQHLATPLQISRSSAVPMLPFLLALSAWFVLTVRQPCRPIELKSRARSGYRLSARGRAPPSFAG